ncbi:MAG: pyrroline-5-carboxylate reductase [Robiginitomaculum sp.]|nr:pyrroline-5-carboxylate reductase [Robiginitomaculum sp.]
MKLRKPRIALIGAGRMGSALLRGWATCNGFAPEGSVLVVDPNCSDSVRQLVEDNSGRVVSATDKDSLTKLEVLVLAVKPQAFNDVAQKLAPILPKNVLIISIIAGTTIDRINNLFGSRAIVRAMPNIAAEIGKSVTVICNNSEVNAKHIARVETLLGTVGSLEHLEDERLMDAVTAVSGSGPAYFFLLVEALAAAGQAEGLPEELARKLAGETLIGSGALFESRQQTPSSIRADVTSSGGTTAAALDVMMGNGAFAEMIRNAVSASTRRSIHLRNSG